MRTLVLSAFLFASITVCRSQATVEQVIIITTDGLRWQEVFRGMDSLIAINRKFNQGDSLYLFNTYWNNDPKLRRQQLMPFFWSTIARDGGIYGNRDFGNYVDVSNKYWFSYPGYNEIFTGYADTLINTNSYPDNPHVTILEFLQQQKNFKGKVAAFCAWEAFNRILNEKRSSIPVIAAFDTIPRPNPSQKMLNAMLKDSHKPWGNGECLDVFTHYAAMEHLKTAKPKVLYIGYGETDEWAHAGQYKHYLDAARQFDSWLKAIWSHIQSDPQYRNKTALFITSDHGRGDKIKEQWTSHGEQIEGAGQIWFSVLSPTIKGKGEVTGPMQLYQNQFAQTISALLGIRYEVKHPTGSKIKFD